MHKTFKVACDTYIIKVVWNTCIMSILMWIKVDYNKILLYFGIFKSHNILPNNVLILGGREIKIIKASANTCNSKTLN